MYEKDVKIHVVGKIPDEVKKISTVVTSITKIEVNPIPIESTTHEIQFEENYHSQLLILILDDDTAHILNKLSLIPVSDHPLLLVIAKEENSELMRLAMKAGSKDFICEPINLNDLTTTLKKIIYEIKHNEFKSGTITSVISVRGGAGSSFIACNLAHICASQTENNTLLLDMDFQCPTQSLYLDIQPQYSIIEVLKKITSLDISAFEGYLTQHKSNLKLLANVTSDHLFISDEMFTTSVKRMLGLISFNYDHIIIDLPRQLNLDSAVVLDKSNNIFVVMKQTVADIHHAKILLNTLKKDLEISPNNIHFIVNHYQSDSSLNVKFITDFLETKNLFVMLQDDELIPQSLNLGKPFLEFAKKSKITEHLFKLTAVLNINVENIDKKTSIFTKIFNKKD